MTPTQPLFGSQASPSERISIDIKKVLFAGLSKSSYKQLWRFAIHAKFQSRQSQMDIHQLYYRQIEPSHRILGSMSLSMVYFQPELLTACLLKKASNANHGI